MCVLRLTLFQQVYTGCERNNTDSRPDKKNAQNYFQLPDLLY